MSESKNVLALNDTNFTSTLAESKGLVLVDFWAEWCGPCRQLAPTIDRLADAHKEKGLSVYKVNVDESPEVSSGASIRSIPTLIVYRDGKKVADRAGALSYEALVAWLESC